MEGDEDGEDQAEEVRGRMGLAAAGRGSRILC